MSILGNATSGLLAFQRALATTGHNIANSATPGYSRQRVEFTSKNPQMLGGTYMGQGVSVSAVRRLQSDLVDAELRTSLSRSSYSDVKAAYSSTVDTLLADSNTGLAPTMDEFFNSIQDVSSDPTSMTARTVMLNNADSLAERLSTINSRLQDQRDLMNDQLGNAVDEINEYSKSLADLNKQIVAYSTIGGSPNDLLDQRDVILNKLAQKLDLTVNAVDDGSVNVFVGNGQPLVMGGVANELVADHLAGDPRNLQIGFKALKGTPVDITRFMTGGEVGALLETRTGVLDEAQNTLGLIALNAATAVNEQQGLGLDLEGNRGTNIFSLPSVGVSAARGNSSGDMPGVTIADVKSLTASDYSLKYVTDHYEITRNSDGTSAVLAVDPTTHTATYDGMSIDVGTVAAPASGDKWLIQPTRYAANGLSVVMTDPAKIAAAGAMSGEVVDTNTGSASVYSVKASDPSNTAWDTPNYEAVVTFNAGAYSVMTSAGPQAVTVTPDIKTNATTISANGWSLTLGGTPANGDQFVVSRNTSVTGDNRNMLAMNGIQDERLVGSDTTLEATYTSLVANVATETRQAQISQDANSALLESAQGARDEISGVNLDEEAADLVRYQQAYQASAQVIATASTIFDTLLNAFRG